MKTHILLFSAALSIFLIPALSYSQPSPDIDFDSNGTADFQDFVLFAKAYGSNQARYDLDELHKRFYYPDSEQKKQGNAI